MSIVQVVGPDFSVAILITWISRGFTVSRHSQVYVLFGVDLSPDVSGSCGEHLYLPVRRTINGIVIQKLS